MIMIVYIIKLRPIFFLISFVLILVITSCDGIGKLKNEVDSAITKVDSAVTNNPVNRELKKIDSLKMKVDSLQNKVNKLNPLN